MPFSTLEKLACAERELAYRRAIYPTRIRRGLLSQSIATHEIKVMEAIAEDYRVQVRGPGLFDRAPQHEDET